MPLKPLFSIINHDVKLYVRRGGELFSVLGFAIVALTLFPIAFGAQNPVIHDYGPAFIWIIALLASLLSAPNIFGRDARDGSLDQLRLSGISLEWVVLAKATANWIGCQLPLVLASPALAMMLGLNAESAGRLSASLLIGTPALSFIGTLGSGLTLQAQSHTSIFALLILPLYIPVLIFASLTSLSDSSTALSNIDEAVILIAITCISLPITCWFTALLLRWQE